MDGQADKLAKTAARQKAGLANTADAFVARRAGAGNADGADEAGFPRLFYNADFHVQKKHGKWKHIPAPELGVPVADAHCHLTLIQGADLSLARAGAVGVGFICNMSDPAERADAAYAQIEGWLAGARAWLSALDAKAAPPRVRMGCGCHPENASKWDADVERRLRTFLADPRTSVLGEIGLDFHWDTSPRKAQRDVFRRQIAIAHELGLPVQLHLRDGEDVQGDAHEEALRILDEEGFPAAGCILHCFNLGPDVAAPFIERDCYFSFGGPLTFSKADDVRAAAALVPASRILTETDCPYMAPTPLRGMPNAPENVVFTARELARARGCATEEDARGLLAQAYENALRLLDKEPLPWQRER